MKLCLIEDDKKPSEFRGSCYYLIYLNTAPISVGDVLSIDCQKDNHVRVLRIWFTLSAHSPHLPVNQTEIGHKHIIELDKTLGKVRKLKQIELEIIDHGTISDIS